VKKGVELRDIAFLRDKIRILPADHEYVDKLHRGVIERLKNYSPSVESASAGEYYLDLTGTRRLFGREIDTCGSIIHELHWAFGFTCSIGIGSTILVARLASQVAGASSVYDVCEPAESLFLAPLGIELIPQVADEVKEELQGSYNVHSIGDLMLFSRSDLQCMFGKEGGFLYDCSRGFARSALVEKKTEKVLERQLIVSASSNNDRFIQRSFFFMIVDLCRQMRQEHLFPRAFCLRVIYQDNYRAVMAGRLREPSFFEKLLYSEMVGYLNRALKRRTCIKKIVLSLSHFTTPSLQLSLFHHDAFRMERLAEAFDLVQRRFGKNSLRYGA
jgi:DNA polymerase-4